MMFKGNWFKDNYCDKDIDHYDCYGLRITVFTIFLYFFIAIPSQIWFVRILYHGWKEQELFNYAQKAKYTHRIAPHHGSLPK